MYSIVSVYTTMYSAIYMLSTRLHLQTFNFWIFICTKTSNVSCDIRNCSKPSTCFRTLYTTDHELL